MPRDQRLYLHEIRDAIERIQAYTPEGRDSLLGSSLIQQAVFWNFAVIGEAASALSDDLKGKLPEVNWRDVIAMRNALIHGYFGIELDIVWRTIENDLPLLSEAVRDLLHSLDQD